MIKFRIFGITLFFFWSTSKARKIFGITFNFFQVYPSAHILLPAASLTSPICVVSTVDLLTTQVFVFVFVFVSAFAHLTHNPQFASTFLSVTSPKCLVLQFDLYLLLTLDLDIFKPFSGQNFSHPHIHAFRTRISNVFIAIHSLVVLVSFDPFLCQELLSPSYICILNRATKRVSLHFLAVLICLITFYRT